MQETVLNPEGRRRAGGDSSHTFSVLDADRAVTPDSQVWKRLFPAESDVVAAVEAETSVGCDLGHFAIEDRIGSGGMGAVFRALDTRLQRVVALKVLSPAQSRDRAAVLRFQNEARAAARLDHENIARVFYFGEDRGLHFIAFEYITGQNVRDLIARTGRLPVSDAVNYTLQIAAALRHTAAASVVHRDIKPSNIIIAPNGRAKLVDLGLARKMTADSIGDLTVAGTTLGTFDYISPEQARDPRNVDVRSDIYSLGCTLYHMLTGGPPYSNGTVLQKLLDHQSGQPPDPRTVNPQVPAALSAICRKMMAGDPKNRHATPDELMRELSIIAAGFGMRPLPADGYVWARPAMSRTPKVRPGVIWASSAAVVVLLAILVDRWPSAIDPEPSAARPAESVASVRGPVDLLPGDSPFLDTPPSDTDAGIPPAPEQSPEPDVVTPMPLIGDAAEPRNDRSVVRIDRNSPTADSDPAALRNPAVALRETPDTRRDGTRSAPTVAPTQDGSESFAELTEQAQNIGRMFQPVVDAFLSEPEPTTASTGPPPETVESQRYGLTKPVVVWTEGAEPQGFDTLAAAIENAYSGDTVELHFDGRPPGVVSNEPILIDDKAITIAAGIAPSGQPYRPLIEFSGDGRSPRSKMIVVSGDAGGLTLDGVELRMTVTGEARSGSKQWALFSMSNAEQVQLRNVGATLVNPEPEAWPLSVFDLRPPEGVPREVYEIAGMMDEHRTDGFLIRLENCFVRGGADLVTIAHTLPGRIELRDSAFALDTALLNVTGGLENPPTGNTVDVMMEHVTAVTGGAVLQLDVDRLPRHVATIDIEAQDSIFAASSPGPLVLMTGNASPETFEQMLVWNGRRNVFDGFPQFWSIFTEAGAADSAATTFDLWKDRWESVAPADPATAEQAVSPDDPLVTIWATPQEARNKSRSEVTAVDLTLDADDLRGVLALPEGDLVGVAPETLPRVSNPPDVLSATGRPYSPR